MNVSIFNTPERREPPLIRKLRRKFVLICMTLVTAVLAVVFVSVYFSAQRSIQENSEAVLERVISEAGSSLLPDVFRPGLNFGADDIQLPYFTVRLVGNNAYLTSGTYADLENTAALEAILNACMAGVGNKLVMESKEVHAGFDPCPKWPQAKSLITCCCNS